MLFNSYVFLFAFLPLTLAGFMALKRAGRDQAASTWLLLASLFFYGWWELSYLPLLLGSILFNYTLGRSCGRAPRGWRRSMLLALGIAGNLMLLGYFKYAGFFAQNLNAVADTGWQLETIGLPLAISFFTFQQIGYLVEVAGTDRAEPKLRRYALFVAFFPQLIAGPIVRQGEMLPQFRAGSRWRIGRDDLAVGLLLFGVGLSKKVIVADGVAPFVGPVFGAAEVGVALTVWEAWLGTLAYTVQIYFDFSGYSDMAVGLGRMFGIRIPLNFNSPYKSRNIIEFWRRWHMTLSRFLRDYVYIVLGGNRYGPAWRYGNLMMTMLIGGLWHGAAWNFIIWGGLHGLYLVINHAWRAAVAVRRPRPGGVGGVVGQVVAWSITFTAVVLAWVFFRAPSFEGALNMLGAMLGGNGLALSPSLEAVLPWLAPFGVRFEGMFHHGLIPPGDAVGMVFIALVIAVVAPNVYAWRPVKESLGSGGSWRPDWRWGLVAGCMLSLGILGVSDENEFLYFNF